MIRLVKMDAQDLVHYLPRLAEEYAQELAQNLAIPLEEARKRAEDSTRGALSQGIDTPGHLLFFIQPEGSQEKIGQVWLYLNEAKSELFIYDIEVLPAFRGRGFARAAMQAIEVIGRERGMQKIGLHVFGNNAVARHLYESLGYQPYSINMRKNL